MRVGVTVVVRVGVTDVVRVGVTVVVRVTDVVGVLVRVTEGVGNGGYETPKVITIGRLSKKEVVPDDTTVTAERLFAPFNINCLPRLSALNAVEPDVLTISKIT